MPPRTVTMATGAIPVNSVGSVPVSIVTGSSSVVVAQQQSDHFRRVIEVQQTQLNLLSQITRSLTDQQNLGVNLRGAPGVTRPGGQNSRLGGACDYVGDGLGQVDQQPSQDFSSAVRGRWP